LNPEIAVVIEQGSVIGIATVGQGITVRVIDLDLKNIGEPDAFFDVEPDVVGIDIEEYTKKMMED
jgi:hypothetical protein